MDSEPGFIHSSKLPDLMEIKEKTLSEFLLHKISLQIEKDPFSVFLIDGISGNKLLYSEMEPLTRRLASALQKTGGISKGDVVIHLTTFQLQQTPLMLALWRLCAVIRSIYKEDDVATTAEKVDESNAKLIFCDEDSIPMVEAALSKLTFTSGSPPMIVVCGEHSTTRVKGYQTFTGFLETGDTSGKLPAASSTGDDVALILPTSGTTGPSKGALHSHSSFLSTIRICASFPFSRTKPNLMASKGTHVSGCAMPFSVLAEGLVGILLPKMNTEIIGQVVTKYQPGYLFAFPTFITALANQQAEYELGSVESIFTGGVVITPNMKAAMMTWPSVKDVYVGYGMTECVTVTGTFTIREGEVGEGYPDTPPGSVGKLFPGAQLQVRDPISRISLKTGEQGELWIKGPSLFTGYFKNSQATEKAFVNGWYATGDVGYVKDGFLFLVDRAKDIFKYFNNHISPTDLENVILSHADVREAVVFPMDDEGGHVPRAVVSLKMKIQDPEMKSRIEQNILEFVNGKLADYKKLRGGLVVVDDLPKGKTGKASRDLAKELWGKIFN